MAAPSEWAAARQQRAGVRAPHPGADPGRKVYRAGTHRTTAPADTVRRLEWLMPTMGITRLADVTGLDRIGVPVVMAVRPNARSVAVSQGKGLDLDAAKASGLMEAAELWHAERIALPLMLATCEELSQRHRVVDVEALPRIAGGRYSPALRMLWIDGRDLLSDERLWLPYEMVHTDYTLPAPTGSGCFPASSNGLASGNHLLEAILHGMCEVVERDATALWHQLDHKRRERTRIDLATIDDRACRAVLDAITAAGLEVAIWETTTDVGMPSFYCLMTDAREAYGHAGAGAGCHPTRGVALSRALTEAIQVRTTYVAGARDDLPPDQYTRAGIAEKRRNADVLRHGSAFARDYRKVPTRELDTLQEDVWWVLERLQAIGIRELALVDLTRPELALPVVRIVIPGLEAPHDAEDYCPGARALAVRERQP